MSKGKNIMIVGVGGQGTLLASRVLGNLLVEEGWDVKVSEVHGMSQRGGSVVTYVKYGESVASPVIEQGEADYILAFELLEAARFLPYLKTDGTLIASTQKIAPMPVITGASPYPENLEEKIVATGCDAKLLDVLSLAQQAGSPKAANVVLLGVLSKQMDIAQERWLAVLERTVPPKFIELNKKAFALGRAL